MMNFLRGGGKGETAPAEEMLTLLKRMKMACPNNACHPARAALPSHMQRLARSKRDAQKSDSMRCEKRLPHAVPLSASAYAQCLFSYVSSGHSLRE
eukprot:1070129-Rhodomonas_salina.1